MRRLAVAVLVTASLVLSLGACSDDNDLSGGDSTLTVFAASSLTESFGSLKKAFEDQHPDADVVLSFGSSTTLAEQIVADAPADLIATANKTSVSIVQKADMLAAQPTEFATNTLVIVTPPDNPAHITRLSDLSSADFIMCDPSAPCGAASKEMLANAGITAQPKSLGADVKAVLNKVKLGEADAGLVYVTDATAAGDKVQSVDIPAKVNVVNPYYIAAVADSPHAELAQEWLELVASKTGRTALHKAGFGTT